MVVVGFGSWGGQCWCLRLVLPSRELWRGLGWGFHLLLLRLLVLVPVVVLLFPPLRMFRSGFSLFARFSGVVPVESTPRRPEPRRSWQRGGSLGRRPVRREEWQFPRFQGRRRKLVSRGRFSMLKLKKVWSLHCQSKRTYLVTFAIHNHTRRGIHPCNYTVFTSACQGRPWLFSMTCSSPMSICILSPLRKLYIHNFVPLSSWKAELLLSGLSKRKGKCFLMETCMFKFSMYQAPSLL